MYIKASQDRLACLLSGRGATDGGSNNARNAASNKRQKRDASSKEPKYGCPEGFTKVTEYLCLYSHNETDGKSILLNFEDAKELCQDKKASLLYFANEPEAKKVWDWLGKYRLFLFFVFLM